MNVNLEYNKPRNVERDPLAHAAHVTRILRCSGEADNCGRTIVEYGPHIPETRHTNGLSEGVLQLALEAGARVLEQACNHHGGEEYQHPMRAA